MKNKKIYIYKLFERFWHWSQAFLIFVLIFTGFEINGEISIMGFENAVRYHNASAVSLILLIIFAIFWHFTSGEWKQYIPTRKNVSANLRYYVTGIFRNEPHPTKKDALNKLNPLQKIIYLSIKIILMPLMVITGLLYMLYRYPQGGTINTLDINGLEVVALLHTLGAFLLTAFVITHIYLTTTGRTPGSNIKSMITGYKEEDDDENNDKKETHDK